MRNTFSPELKWLIMKFETQEMNGLSGNPRSKHMTEEYLPFTFIAEERERSFQCQTPNLDNLYLIMPRLWIASSGRGNTEF